jgi:hypothetical protein
MELREIQHEVKGGYGLSDPLSLLGTIGPDARSGGVFSPAVRTLFLRAAGVCGRKTNDRRI